MSDLIFRFDPDGRHAVNLPADASEAAKRLEAGNRQFARLLTRGPESASFTHVLRFDADDLGIPCADGTAPRQEPFAAVLGCSDARVPIEMIFGQACNDLFVVRVAGNVLGAECLGSLDYALTALGASLKLVIVLGHSGCGAVSATVDAFIDPTKYLQFASSHPLRAIVDRVFAAVRAGHAALEVVYGQQVEDLPGYRRALIETSVVLNAALTAATVLDEFRGRLDAKCGVVYGVYDLVTRRVKVNLEPHEADVAIRLAPPPANADDYGRLGILIASSGMVRDLLTPK